MMDPSSSFGEMMQHAVKIKGAQMSKLRPTFDSYPTFFQNTMFLKEEVRKLRDLPFAERLAAATELKSKGNAKYATKDYVAAQTLYEEALGVMKYIKNTHAEWKTRGIRDEEIDVVDDCGETPGDREQAKAFKVSCFLNMAQSQKQQKKFDMVVHACNYALEVDDANVKALYRRAMAWLTSMASGAMEEDMAMADLKTALRVEPGNKRVRTELRKLKDRRALQAKADKNNFSGMFERGEVVAEAEEEALRPRKTAAEEAKDKAQEEKERSAPSGRSLKEQLNDMETKIKVLERDGQYAEADSLHVRLSDIRSKIEAEVTKRQRAEMDFSNPTSSMVEDAKTRGIDLTDPVVRRYLTELQAKKDEDPNFDPTADLPDNVEAGGDALGSAGSGAAWHRRLPRLNTPTIVVISVAVFFLFRMWRMGLLQHLFGVLMGQETFGDSKFFDHVRQQMSGGQRGGVHGAGWHGGVEGEADEFAGHSLATDDDHEF